MTPTAAELVVYQAVNWRLKKALWRNDKQTSYKKRALTTPKTTMSYKQNKVEGLLNKSRKT